MLIEVSQLSENAMIRRQLRLEKRRVKRSKDESILRNDANTRRLSYINYRTERWIEDIPITGDVARIRLRYRIEKRREQRTKFVPVAGDVGRTHRIDKQRIQRPVCVRFKKSSSGLVQCKIVHCIRPQIKSLKMNNVQQCDNINRLCLQVCNGTKLVAIPLNSSERRIGGHCHSQRYGDLERDGFAV